MDELGLDWETYNTIDIKDGTYKYLSSPDLEPLLGAYNLNGGQVYLEDYTVTPWLSRYLTEAFKDPNVNIRAFNAAFERLAIWYMWGIWVPIERFRCTMVEAWSLSFYGKMNEVGEQMGLPAELIKMEGGSALINKFCKPAPKNHKADRYTRHNAADRWHQFRLYNMQDVKAEYAIAQAIKPYAFTEDQWQEYFVDQRINDRGLPVDMASVEGAILIAHNEKARVLTQLIELTGLENPNSGQQLHGWLEEAGLPLENLQKETISKVLKEEQLPEFLREVLELKQLLAKTSVTKYKSLKKGTVHVKSGDWLRGCFQFGGAQRTKRWAGRMFQPHNLPSPVMENPENYAGMLAQGGADLIRKL